MNYIVHVIDNASQFKKNNSDFEMVKSTDDKAGECDVLVSDAFYHVNAKDPFSTVIIVSNIIEARLKNGERMPASKAFVDTKRSLSVTNFDSTTPNKILSDIKENKKVNPYSSHFTASCHIEKENGLIELHRVEFFIVEDNRIMEII